MHGMATTAEYSGSDVREENERSLNLNFSD
jgi:hypothetical protein